MLMLRKAAAALRVRLIEDVRHAWRLWSVRVSAIGAILFAVLTAAPDQALALWQALPPEVQDLVPNARQLGLALLTASAIARVVRQRGPLDQAEG